MKARALPGLILAAALAAAGVPAAAAGLSVDSLQLISSGSLNDSTGLFEVDSRLFFDLSIEGGDKFGGLLKLDFLSSDIESALDLAGDEATAGNTLSKLDNLTSMGLRTAAVTAKRLFDSPLELTYFVGLLDSLCSGADFPALFGSEPFGTDLSGPMVFPDGIGTKKKLYYDGIDAIYGTGFRLGLAGRAQAVYLYAYQDSDIGKGSWSATLRGLLDTGVLELEAYAGASYASGTAYGLYRAGLLFNLKPGDVGEFFAQVGLTRLDPEVGLSIDDFYFLFEPRLNFYPGSLAVTVFYHPGWYRQVATNDENALDLNVNLKFGSLAKAGAQGGMDSTLSFRPHLSEALTIDLSPYYTAIASGMEWSFKLSVRLFPFPSEWYGMFTPFIGVKTSF